MKIEERIYGEYRLRTTQARFIEAVVAALDECPNNASLIEKANAVWESVFRKELFLK